MALMVFPVWAETCAGGAGQVVHGSKSGTYCLSDRSMNWFSAFSWCRGAGYRLATFAEVCPTAAPGDAWCSNNGTAEIDRSGWTGTPKGEGKAYIVNVKGGLSQTDDRHKSHVAICIVSSS